ncbi:pilus assembly protein TadG-related protein [Microvirga sp. VF16]|uniref:pilus assembly protein TadG-related protein n=1 Tax=Microvirga sp. VF16 TaxID=2807101 RepID=UPI00193E7074|nr:pilus assembly protein TadG-related protein [Microvirga sp. VF16]QRM27652.1 hypothetical protein JO965_15350 [Microvirga sp. VF16]
MMLEKKLMNRLCSWAGDVKSGLGRLKADDRGAAAVVMGLVSPILIGGMALGAETGYWYYTQRKLQHAADVAAHAAGIRKRVGDSQMRLETAALQVATISGFVPVKVAEGQTQTVTNFAVHNPPQSGAYTKQSTAVEVNLYETHPRMLSSIFSDDPIRIAARAVAKLEGGSPACVLALSETKQKAIEVSGSSSATLKDCSVAANSVQPDAYYMPNSTAYLSADCISTVGEAAIKNPSPDLLDLKVCTSVQENAPKTLDPYADVLEPNLSTAPACEAKNKFDGPVTIAPATGNIMRFCNGLTLKGAITFKEDVLYIIDGGELKITGGELHGDRVTFFFANDATADLAGRPLLDLSAPSTGPYAGLLFFSSRCDLSPTTCGEVFKITGNVGSTVQGALYLPGSAVEFLGNSESTNDCLQVIADKVTFTGNSTIKMGSACSAAGTRDIVMGQVVKLVE